jgi:hypothetical protein
MGHSGTIEMMAEQLGLAITPLCAPMAWGLISGTTSGTPSSMRNAEELSMTTAPAFTAMGAKRLEMPLPAENNAMSTPSKLASVSSSIRRSRPRNFWVLPTERADASNRSSDTGKLRCSRQRAISTPTAPVAPTTATTKDGAACVAAARDRSV